MLGNNRDTLRDPIWQFIGVVVSAVAIFMAYLTLPSSIQGATLVMVVATTIALLLLFVRNKTTRLLLTCIFFFASFMWSLIIDGFTYYQIPFFRENFGIAAPGAIYAKSNIGLALIIIEYILYFAVLMLFFRAYIAEKKYIMILSGILIYSCFLFFSLPNLYMPNFFNIKILTLDLGYPKTALGLAIYIMAFLGFILLFLGDRKKLSHLSRKLPQK